MRRNTILLAALPLANALSLANFQDITSVLIPVTCLLTYAQQIPKCKVADFEKPGCSEACQAQLTQLATAVTRACSNVIVNSNTLLGIVKSGNILPALCPAFDSPSATTTPPKSTAAVQSSTQAVSSPTKSTGMATTTSTRQAQSATNTPTATKSTSSTATPLTEPTNTPTAEPTPIPSPTTLAADNGLGGGGVTSSSTTSSTAGAAASPVNKASDNGLDTGGGSPFDISSSGASHSSRKSILSLVVAIGAGLLIAR